MPEPSDHSRIEGKYNDWQVKTTSDGQHMVALVAGENGETLMWSESYKDKRDALTLVDRMTSGNTMQRFSDLT